MVRNESRRTPGSQRKKLVRALRRFSAALLVSLTIALPTTSTSASASAVTLPLLVAGDDSSIAISQGMSQLIQDDRVPGAAAAIRGLAEQGWTQLALSESQAAVLSAQVLPFPSRTPLSRSVTAVPGAAAVVDVYSDAEGFDMVTTFLPLATGVSLPSPIRVTGTTVDGIFTGDVSQAGNVLKTFSVELRAAGQCDPQGVCDAAGIAAGAAAEVACSGILGLYGGIACALTAAAMVFASQGVCLSTVGAAYCNQSRDVQYTKVNCDLGACNSEVSTIDRATFTRPRYVSMYTNYRLGNQIYYQYRDGLFRGCQVAFACTFAMTDHYNIAFKRSANAVQFLSFTNWNCCTSTGEIQTQSMWYKVTP